MRERFGVKCKTFVREALDRKAGYRLNKSWENRIARSGSMQKPEQALYFKVENFSERVCTAECRFQFSRMLSAEEQLLAVFQNQAQPSPAGYTEHAFPGPQANGPAA